MRPRSILSAFRRAALCSLYSRHVPWGDRGPIVSFSFDDFPRTACTVGGAILKSLGAKGTYYAATGLMNSENHLGQQFCPEDIESLLRDGHELASHTFSHISCKKVSISDYRADVDRGRKAIEELSGVADSGNFAYPFGDVTLDAKKILGPQLCSSRSIFPGFNGPNVDLNLLKANSLYGDSDQLEKAQKLILENRRRKSWLIFYSHDVRPSPSVYGCTPSLLEATVSFALKQDSRVLTVREVLADLKVSWNPPSASTVN
jgi:peptidoglycan/xylan/chitin deacetylase (PgdA/CDA1 family)